MLPYEPELLEGDICLAKAETRVLTNIITDTDISEITMREMRGEKTCDVNLVGNTPCVYFYF